MVSVSAFTLGGMEVMKERVEAFCGVEKAGSVGIPLATCSAGSARGPWQLNHSRVMNAAVRTASFNARGLPRLANRMIPN